VNEEWWESPVCFVCDRWPILLIGLIAALAAYFTRDYWLPLAPMMPTPPPATATLGTGDVQATLRWNTLNDLDLYVIDPAGNVIFYYQPSSSTGGILDVDANRDCLADMSLSPVENIYWPFSVAPAGTYHVEVEYYAHCPGAPLEDSYSVRLLVDGQVKEFDGTVSAVKERDAIYEFTR